MRFDHQNVVWSIWKWRSGNKKVRREKKKKREKKITIDVSSTPSLFRIIANRKPSPEGDVSLRPYCSGRMKRWGTSSNFKRGACSTTRYGNGIAYNAAVSLFFFFDGFCHHTLYSSLFSVSLYKVHCYNFSPFTKSILTFSLWACLVGHNSVHHNQWYQVYYLSTLHYFPFHFFSSATTLKINGSAPCVGKTQTVYNMPNDYGKIGIF